MSELKEYLCVEALVPYTNEIPGYLFRCAKYRAPQAEMKLVYLKSEADKVIAHHKYKRCVAMARWCNEKWLVHNFAEIPTKLGFYDRWEKRWLELAEKFKETKYVQIL